MQTVTTKITSKNHLLSMVTEHHTRGAQAQHGTMRKNWMKTTVKRGILICIFLFVSSLAFAQSERTGTYPAQTNKAKILLHVLANSFFTVPPNDYVLSDSIGGMLGLKSTEIFGLSFTMLRNSFGDKVDPNLQLINQIYTLDIFADLPVPGILNIAVGYGVGNSSLVCNSERCETIYGGDLEIKKSGTMTHMYIKTGIVFGQIYDLEFGYHMFEGGKFTVNHPSFTQEREISQKLAALSAGFAINF